MFGKKDKERSASVEDVREALSKVVDPILEKNLVELGMVRDVSVDDTRARIVIELPTPGWEAKELLETEIRAAVKKRASKVELELGFTHRVLPARPDAVGGQNLVPEAQNIILCASGKGGVGKSTVASNLATALSRMGANVGLLDADIYGPSIPTMFGTHEMPAMSADQRKLIPVSQHGLKLMSIGFVVKPEDAMVWRGPMLQKTLLQFMGDVDWGRLDYLVVDLPPGTGDIQLTLAQNVKVAGAILVSTPQDVALADVTRGKAMFDKVNIPVLGVVENMAWFECPSCKEKHHIFASGGASKLAAKLGLPVLGEVPIEIAVRESGDAGKPETITHPDSRSSRAFYSIARRVATELARQAATAAKSQQARGRLRIVQ
ncbi:MAG: iron-sulfur cluster carrier protein ApbC [Deltaproteobacteria bacterium]|nr:iron-sulfur cluster carrier protein ApbC [Deltaproteobacteria bacterium]